MIFRVTLKFADTVMQSVNLLLESVDCLCPDIGFLSPLFIIQCLNDQDLFECSRVNRRSIFYFPGYFSQYID